MTTSSALLRTGASSAWPQACFKVWIQGMDRQTVTSFPIGVHLKINTNKNLWKELEQIFDVLFMNWALVKWKNKTLTRLKIDVQRTTQWLVKALSWEGKMKSYFIKDWSSESVGLETKQQALQHCDCSVQWAVVGRPRGEQAHSVPLPKNLGATKVGSRSQDQSLSNRKMLVTVSSVPSEPLSFPTRPNLSSF